MDSVASFGSTILYEVNIIIRNFYRKEMPPNYFESNHSTTVDRLMSRSQFHEFLFLLTQKIIKHISEDSVNHIPIFVPISFSRIPCSTLAEQIYWQRRIVAFHVGKFKSINHKCFRTSKLIINCASKWS